MNCWWTCLVKGGDLMRMNADECTVSVLVLSALKPVFEAVPGKLLEEVCTQARRREAH